MCRDGPFRGGCFLPGLALAGFDGCAVAREMPDQVISQIRPFKGRTLYTTPRNRREFLNTPPHSCVCLSFSSFGVRGPTCAVSSGSNSC